MLGAASRVLFCLYLMDMKKVLLLLLSLGAILYAENIQVVAPSGADFVAPDAPQVVYSLVRAAVSQSGNTPVTDSSDVQLRTNIMTMGASYIVVCEQVKSGVVVGSGKQKVANVDALDSAIELAVLAALGVDKTQETPAEPAPAPDPVAAAPAADTAAAPKKEPLPVNTSVITVEVEEAPVPKGEEVVDEKRPTHNYNSFGLGVALWHNYDYKKDPDDDGDRSEERSWSATFAIHYARLFEVSPHAAITMLNNANFVLGKGWEIHETFLIGGRYYVNSTTFSPFFGAGLGIGGQVDSHYENFSENLAVGVAGGVEVGFVLFRNSALQLELGAAWDALWDGFDSFKRRFGSGTLYISLNY